MLHESTYNSKTACLAKISVRYIATCSKGALNGQKKHTYTTVKVLFQATINIIKCTIHTTDRCMYKTKSIELMQLKA